MKYMLPHRFKFIGMLITPLGCCGWLTMQFGYIDQLLDHFLLKHSNERVFEVVNIIVAVTSFFSFLTGIYFLSFAKEKMEDEMVQHIRLESFQFAAITQWLFIITTFILMCFWGEPGDSGFILLLAAFVLFFWLIYILRFHYYLHVKLRNDQ